MTGPEITALRRRYGLTRPQLAEILNLSLSRLVDFENGHSRDKNHTPAVVPLREAFALDCLARLAQYLGYAER